MRLSQTVVKCEPVNGYESGVVVTINETDTMYIGRAYTTYNGFTEEDVLKQVNGGGMKCFLLPIAPASMNSEMSQIVYGNAPLLSWMKPLEVVSRESPMEQCMFPSQLIMLVICTVNAVA